MSEHTLGPIGTRRPPAKNKAVQFSIYLPRDLMTRLDIWRDRQHVRPTRMAVLRQIITEWLDREESR